MSHLLAITLGPVQEFISAARRTRDLWFGSFALSELSRAAARAVENAGGKLIFPASSMAPSVANVIVAELPDGDPHAVAAQAKEAVRLRWRQFAEEARQEAEAIIRLSLWNDQVDDVVEFYAAWVRRTDNYAEDRARVMRLLGGRKNCRDFLPAKGSPGVPKSSLDGQRESVLKDPAIEKWPPHLRTRFRIRSGEQLDVVGVVKRVAGGKRRYPSMSRIAADPWIRGNKNHPSFDQLRRLCDEIPASVLHRLDDFPQFQDFPYEGTVVYPSRHREWNEEVDEGDLDPSILKRIQDVLIRLPEPLPYLAVLVADGDRMGKALAQLSSPDEHRTFSARLAEFAKEAERVVAAHHGVLVYAGGDDVLAFLPVDKCLPCARQLHDAFAARMQSLGSMTLSVGIAIGHYLENMEDLLDYARTTEKLAKKPDRDGLAISLHKRSGSPIRVRYSWSRSPDRRLTEFAELLQVQALPSKVPYDLHELVDLYKAEGWKENRVEAMHRDALRIISAKQPRAGRRFLPRIRGVIGSITSAEGLEDFVEELLVARLLASVYKQAGRPPQVLSGQALEVGT